MSFTHKFHPSVLREYDIRGIVGETLSTHDAQAVGRTFGTIVRRNGGTRVCVGYDGRLSSPSLEAALVDGLKSTGVHVERVGRGPTPSSKTADVLESLGLIEYGRGPAARRLTALGQAVVERIIADGPSARAAALYGPFDAAQA